MGKRRAYRSTAVKKVVLEKVLESSPIGDVHVGMDIGKGEIFVVVRWEDRTFERPWKVANPTEIARLVGLLQALAEERVVTVAMESTGTYGDALRQALGDAGVSVHRVGSRDGWSSPGRPRRAADTAIRTDGVERVSRNATGEAKAQGSGEEERGDPASGQVGRRGNGLCFVGFVG